MYIAIRQRLWRHAKRNRHHLHWHERSERWRHEQHQYSMDLNEPYVDQLWNQSRIIRRTMKQTIFSSIFSLLDYYKWYVWYHVLYKLVNHSSEKFRRQHLDQRMPHHHAIIYSLLCHLFCHYDRIVRHGFYLVRQDRQLLQIKSIYHWKQTNSFHLLNVMDWQPRQI